MARTICVAVALVIAVHLTTALPTRPIPASQTPMERKIFTHTVPPMKVPTTKIEDMLAYWSNTLVEFFRDLTNRRDVKPMIVDRQDRQLGFPDSTGNASADGKNLYEQESQLIDLEGEEGSIAGELNNAEMIREKRSFLDALFGYPSGYYRRRWWPAHRGQHGNRHEFSHGHDHDYSHDHGHDHVHGHGHGHGHRHSIHHRR